MNNTPTTSIKPEPKLPEMTWVKYKAEIMIANAILIIRSIDPKLFFM